MSSLQELVVLIAIIGALSLTGIWPVIVRGLRELRGEPVNDEGQGQGPLSSKEDLDMCYRILGLSSHSSWEDVEKAYRRKAKIHHPDHGGDEETMRAVNEAYSRLKKLRRK